MSLPMITHSRKTLFSSTPVLDTSKSNVFFSMQGHEISFFNLLLFFASGRFSIPLPTAVQACE